MSTPGTRPMTIVPLSPNVLLSHGPVSPRSTGPLGALGEEAGVLARHAPLGEHQIVSVGPADGQLPRELGFLLAPVGVSDDQRRQLIPRGRYPCSPECRGAAARRRSGARSPTPRT